MGKGKFKAELYDQGEAETILRAIADMRREVHGVMEDIASDAEIIFAAHALKGASGRLSRGMTTITAGDTLIVKANAKDPRTGYDYVGVTRFGHRKKFIEPKKRGKASVVATGTKRARGKRAALRFVIGGEVFFRRRVRGFKPRSDWAEDALPEIETDAQTRMASFGRGFVVKLS